MAQSASLWTELQGKRDALTGFHQEFDVAQVRRSAHALQTFRSQISLDLAHGRWRQKTVSGSGDDIKIFDGRDLLRMEEGGDEYVRVKQRPNKEDSVPAPYAFGNPDETKISEAGRQNCGLAGADRSCAVFDMPLKAWSRHRAPGEDARLIEGSARVMLDPTTGLLVSSRVTELVETAHSRFQLNVVYKLKRMTYGTTLDASLFKLPSDDLREVKELSRWDASRMKKQLAGKPAPELTLTDIQGKSLKLADFKGKVVLLDFWTTWCGPCKADGPALEQLYRRYGEKDLQIVGISVDEDRSAVEQFLHEHPHSYPIALTAENEMPRPFQVREFPTYIVIDRAGIVASAADGDQGFGELRKSLKKAGLEDENR